jgi:glycosyltransferase involved in cell wall biosynthesis
VIRVTLLIENLSAVGGAERLVAETAVRLDRTRFAPEVWVTRPLLGRHAARIAAAGIPVHALRRRSMWNVTAWTPLVRRLRETDVLHAHMHTSNVYGALLGRLARVPVVLTHEHTWSWQGQRVRRLLDRLVVGRLSTLHLAVSEADRRAMTDVERIPPAKTHFVPLGIPSLEPSAEDARDELGIPRGAPVVGTAAGLRAQKALDLLVDAARRLAPDFPAVQVLIAGDGPEERRLQTLIEEQGLQETVRLVGRWPEGELPRFLATLDVAVNCSDFEGSPLAVMEFMACEKAIVATAVGGTPDLIEDGVHGLLVRTRDAGALADAIAALLRDPVRRREFGRRARERQRADFDVDVVVRRFEQLYQELYEHSRRRR